jgi:type I restriction enzyme S subunit
MREFAAEGWQRMTVKEAADLKVTYGLPEQELPTGRGVIRAGDVRNGRVRTSRPDLAAPSNTKGGRAILAEGDLVVVLVRRVGDAALIDQRHSGWVTTRSVGILRARNPDITRWLKVWFQTPTARAWFDRHVSAHVEPTLSIDRLKAMEVAVPPRERIETITRLVELLQDKSDLNQRIAADAVALADAHHAMVARRQGPSWMPSTFGAVASVAAGRPGQPPPVMGGVATFRIAPADVLGADPPYIQGGRETLAEPGDVCEPGTVLVASRPEGARAALTWSPSTPNRGVLAVRPSDPSDRWWLLHELRSRSGDISEIAQGRQAREISRRAFSQLELSWPGPEVRRRFQEAVEPLHGRARLALEENRLLKELLDRVLRDVSSIAARI